MMFTSLLHHPVVLISHEAHRYIEEHKRERKKRTGRMVKYKEMHIRNIDNGDYLIYRISSMNAIT
jgi:translation initiation factor IF-3